MLLSAAGTAFSTEKIEALGDYAKSPLFSDAEKVALEYADAWENASSERCGNRCACSSRLSTPGWAPSRPRSWPTPSGPCSGSTRATRAVKHPRGDRRPAHCIGAAHERTGIPPAIRGPE